VSLCRVHSRDISEICASLNIAACFAHMKTRLEGEVGLEAASNRHWFSIPNRPSCVWLRGRQPVYMPSCGELQSLQLSTCRIRSEHLDTGLCAALDLCPKPAYLVAISSKSLAWLVTTAEALTTLAPGPSACPQYR
jgi:hypothetical protein